MSDEGESRPNGIYLDHNATTASAEAVVAAMAACEHQGHANPASSHAAGRRARRVLEQARDEIAGLLSANTSGATADRVILTSGGTEANNLAVLGLAAAATEKEREGTPETHGPSGRRGLGETSLAGRLPLGLTYRWTDWLRPQAVISAIEHPSVVGPAELLARLGWQVDRVGVSRDGAVRLDELERLLTERTRLVSVMLGNNETGVLQPVTDVASVCRARGIAMHTDAVQAVGKIAVDFRSLGVDAMTVAAHKFHGPRGIGALVVRAGTAIEPILFGGFQQGATRPGTESVTLAVGMAAALKLWRAEAEARERGLRELRDSFEAALAAGWPGLVVNGSGADRLPHTTNVSFPGLDRQALFMALDMAEVCCSTGSACASGSNEPSPVLLAMGCDEAVVGSALRFSFGITNTAAEAAEAARRILKVANDLRARKKA